MLTSCILDASVLAKSREAKAERVRGSQKKADTAERCARRLSKTQCKTNGGSVAGHARRKIGPEQNDGLLREPRRVQSQGFICARFGLIVKQKCEWTVISSKPRDTLLRLLAGGAARAGNAAPAPAAASTGSSTAAGCCSAARSSGSSLQLLQAAQELVALLPRLRPLHRLLRGEVHDAGLNATHCTTWKGGERVSRPFSERPAASRPSCMHHALCCCLHSAHQCANRSLASAELRCTEGRRATSNKQRTGTRARACQVASQALRGLAVPVHGQRGPGVSVVPGKGVQRGGSVKPKQAQC